MRESIRLQQNEKLAAKTVESDDESLADIDDVPVPQMKEKKISYIYANNDLTDEFLFGDEILIDEPKTKKNNKSKAGPKSYVSDTVSSISDGRAVTDTSSVMTKSSKNKNCTVFTKKTKNP